MKPLWRWTVGACQQQGLEILEESVFKTMRALGEDNWDWAICYNNLNAEQQNFLHYIVQSRPIQVIKQSWVDCPVVDVEWTPIRIDGTFEVDGSRCGGTMWKVCPGRMRINSYEVIMDNDIIISKKLPQLDYFLSSNKLLILEEPIRYYGRYNKVIPPGNNLNSGLMGFPPGFDFDLEIRLSWEEQGQHGNITQEDEQGLLMYTMQKYPNIRISKEEIVEVLAAQDPSPAEIPYGMHFVQANRTNNHKSWRRYQEIVSGLIAEL